MIFRFIAAKKTEHSIQIMCRVLEVSRSGYHAWAVRPPSARAIADEQLTGRIAVIHKESRKTYGSPRVHAELRLGRLKLRPHADMPAGAPAETRHSRWRFNPQG